MELEAEVAAFSRWAVKSLESDQMGDAIMLAKTSAKLALALAKLNGRFDHNISVRKVEKPEQEQLPALPAVLDEPQHPQGAPYPPPYEGEPPLFTKEEWESETLVNEELWARDAARKEERARRAGWI